LNNAFNTLALVHFNSFLLFVGSAVQTGQALLVSCTTMKWTTFLSR